MDNFFYDKGNLIGFKLPLFLYDKFYIDFYSKYNCDYNTLETPEAFWKKMSYKYNNINLIAPEQIHGTDIISLSDGHFLPERPEADGIFIREGDSGAACLRFADCTPVVIAGIKPVPWLLLLHSGFNGTLLDISGKTLRVLRDSNKIEYCGSDDIYAWVGPSICKKCYMRKYSDPKSQLALSVFSIDNLCKKEEYIFFDIKSQIRYQLLRSGVPAENIYVNHDCTNCLNNKYLSYRSGDKISRMFLVAGAVDALKKK